MRTQLGIYNNVCLTAIYKDASADSLKEKLIAALSAVVAEHPILSAVPVTDGFCDPHFAHLSEIDIAATLTVQECPGGKDFQETLDAVLEEQHNNPFLLDHTPLTPFWRLHVFDGRSHASKFSVCFCFHHSLMDTKSAIVFQQALERAMTHVTSSHPPDVISLPSKPLLPSAEELHTFPVCPSFIATQKAESDPPANVWSGGVQRVPVKTRVHSFWTTEMVTHRLMARCREKKTSVTSLLMALLAESFFHEVPSDFTTVYGECAMSIRRFMPDIIDDDSMGVFIGVFRQGYERGNGVHSVWDDSTRTKRTMDGVIAKNGADQSAGYLRLVPDLADWFRKKLGRKRWAAWELSNVGALPKSCTNDGRTARIESLLFSQSASACSAVLKVSVATGRDGRLGFCFSWQEGAADENVINGVIERFSRHINGPLDFEKENGYQNGV